MLCDPGSYNLIASRLVLRHRLCRKLFVSTCHLETFQQLRTQCFQVDRLHLRLFHRLLFDLSRIQYSIICTINVLELVRIFTEIRYNTVIKQLALSLQVPRVVILQNKHHLRYYHKSRSSILLSSRPYFSKFTSWFCNV